MFDIIDKGYRNIDRNNSEYQGLLKQRQLYKVYRSDYKEVKWATEVLDKLENKSAHDYYTGQDREEFYKAREIIDTVSLKLKTDRLKAEHPTTHYIWRTVGDSNVRDSHAENDGQIFAWDSSPDIGHPGEDYGCRCTAEDIIPEEAGEKPNYFPPLPTRRPDDLEVSATEEDTNKNPQATNGKDNEVLVHHPNRTTEKRREQEELEHGVITTLEI